MARAARIGDVLEFRLEDGLHYAQFTHRHPRFGHLCRVLEGAYRQRPSAFEMLVEDRPGYFAFTYLPALLRDGLGEIVARLDVPEAYRPFPLFKAAAGVGEKVRNWWLWDGEKEWRVGELPPEYWD